jgi:hypothetical protein
MDRDGAGVHLDKALPHRQPEARAFALRRKERLKQSLPRLFIYGLARV